MGLPMSQWPFQGGRAFLRCLLPSPPCLLDRDPKRHPPPAGGGGRGRGRARPTPTPTPAATAKKETRKEEEEEEQANLTWRKEKEKGERRRRKRRRRGITALLPSPRLTIGGTEAGVSPLPSSSSSSLCLLYPGKGWRVRGTRHRLSFRNCPVEKRLKKESKSVPLPTTGRREEWGGRGRNGN